MGDVAVLAGACRSLGGRRVLHALDLAVRAGEVTALLGPNGAGKSTTVGLLTGQLAVDAGAARLFGLDPRDARARGRMGVMLQAAGLPDTLTVSETVALFRGYYPRARPQAEALAVAGIADLAGRRCGALSGGQARRVQFALAMAGRPELLVLDEPTTGLDPDARRALWASVRAEADAGAAVLLTTHHLDEADALADRVVVIDGGRIVADGTPAAIKAAVAGSTVRVRTRLPDAWLRGLPGVRAVARDGAHAVIASADGVATVQALLGADPAAEDLSVGAAGLEEALRAIVDMKEAA